MTLSEGFQNPVARQTPISSKAVLHSTSPQKNSSPEAPTRRRILLSRDGPYFHLDRATGAIEFGATAKLITKLDANPNPDLIADWLSDERGLALSIWDESMMTEIRKSVYQLQTMKLQFVTIQLAPTVDMRMETRFAKNDPKQPVFLLQSVGFDPNIQLLPGLSMSAEDLGIEIEVSGELRPTKDGMGVSGRIAFQTSGILPPPMRILPASALQAATDSINQLIVNQAIQSFEKGATTKYNEFRQAKHQPQTPPKPPQ